MSRPDENGNENKPPSVNRPVKQRGLVYRKKPEPIDFHRDLYKTVDNLEFVNESVLSLGEGLNTDFISIWQKLALCDVFYSGRFKPRGLKNTRNDPSSPKKMKMKPKSAHPKNIYFGHLPIDNAEIVGPTINSEVGGKIVSELGHLKFKGDIVPVTFERQTINLIKTKIESGEYKLVDCDLDSYDEHLNKKVPKITIETPVINADGSIGVGTYVIRLAEFGKATALKPSVRTLIKRFEQRITPGASEAMNNFKKLLQSTDIIEHMEETVKILRVKDGVINEDPHILSDESGNPIKGDVDMQNTFLPDYLPPRAFKFIGNNITPESLITEFRELILTLKKYGGPDPDERLTFIIKTIENAIARLNERPEYAKEMIYDIGVINIFNAAMVIGLNTDILHGSEAGSPVWPENITVTIMPNPTDRYHKSYITTHNEFEQIHLLHVQKRFLDNKIMDFNPCWFVKAQVVNPNNNWRKDLSAADATNKFPCNNRTDEALSIEMWKLLFEKQLLIYMKNHSGNFSDYVSTITENLTEMCQNPISAAMKPEGLRETLIAGTQVATMIINKVKNECANDSNYVDARLKKIEKITSEPTSKLKDILAKAIDRKDQRSSSAPPRKLT